MARYPLIDMFAGAGCASLGFRRAGFDIAAALEIDPDRCDIYERNFGKRPVQKDVMRTSAGELLGRAGLRRGSMFCVVGCPPCQSFSKLSDTSRVDTRTDPRSRFVLRFGRLVAQMSPAAVVFENVPWMMSGPGKKFFDAYVADMRRAGYHTVPGVVNAADVGVPQNRRRVVAISVKRRLLNRRRMELLEGFHGGWRKRRRTVGDAIRGLPRLRPGQHDPSDPLHAAADHDGSVLKRIRHVPRNGGSRKQVPRRLWLECHRRLGSGAGTSYGRMSWGGPSPTMTCRCTTPSCGRFIHPSQNRGITLREAARLQSIPDSFDFGGLPSGRIESMIGDAVPPALARQIGLRLARVLDG